MPGPPSSSTGTDTPLPADLMVPGDGVGTFDEELMTGFISLSGKSPLSVMTIGSMADLGYAVDPAAADRYHISGRQERVAGDVTSARLNLGGRERLIQPSAVVQ